MGLINDFCPISKNSFSKNYEKQPNFHENGSTWTYAYNFESWRRQYNVLYKYTAKMGCFRTG